MSDVFDSLRRHARQPAAMLDEMIEHFRSGRHAMELFEARKMRVRHDLGLPLVTAEPEPNKPDEIERQLEVGLLAACREAGLMLLADGQVGQGWMYLRPSGDVELAREQLAKIEITETNYDEMVQVLLHEGVDIGRGYRAVLDRQGTCNAITLYDQALVQRSKADRRAAAAQLLDHLYDELSEAVRGDIARRMAPAGNDETLHEMLAKRPEIMKEGGYHLDTTHVASTVRIAATVNDPDRLRKAWELTQYGRQLHPQFQYPGEEPFVDFYPAYAAFYSVLRGQNVEAGLKLFERRAKSVDPLQHGTAAIETYVDLLDRSGRHAAAVAAITDLVPDEVPPPKIVPLAIDMAIRARQSEQVEALEPILAYCQRRGDVLGYAAALESKPN